MSLGVILVSLLEQALKRDERDLRKWHRKQAWFKDREPQAIWSVRHYAEAWLQYVLMKAALNYSNLELNFEQSISSRRRLRVDVCAYAHEKPVGLAEISGPYEIPKHLNGTRQKVTADLKKLLDGATKRVKEVWVVALLWGEDFDLGAVPIVDLAKLPRNRRTLEYVHSRPIGLNPLKEKHYGVLRIVAVGAFPRPA